MCPQCNSFEWEWAKSSGKGKVHTWTVVHQAFIPAFADDVPYAGVIVGLEEGPRIMSTVTGISPDELRMEMPVEVWFDDVTPEVSLPKFKPA